MNINASLFLQMVVFFLGAWITMKFIWPPLNRAIEERQKKIADGLSAANKGEKALAIATEQGKAIEADARARATTIVSDGEKRAQSIVDEAKAQAQVEASSRMLVLKLLRKCSVLVKRFVTKWLLLPLPVLSRSWPVRSTRPFTPPCLNN